MNYSSSEEAAAQYLIEARRAGRTGDRLPESCRPADIEAALAIQRRVSEVLAQPGEGMIGFEAWLKLTHLSIR